MKSLKLIAMCFFFVIVNENFVALAAGTEFHIELKK